MAARKMVSPTTLKTAPDRVVNFDLRSLIGTLKVPGPLVEVQGQFPGLLNVRPCLRGGRMAGRP